MSFENFIGALRLRHFKSTELLVAVDRRGNDRPPPELWHNIALTVTILDRLRAELGRPIRVTSCYRSPTYNRAAGGVALSQHQAFCAIDFAVRGIEPAAAAEPLRRWRSEVTLFRLPVRIQRVAHLVAAGRIPFAEVETWDRRDEPGCMLRFAGGVGVYRSFVHLDTRGINASWAG